MDCNFIQSDCVSSVYFLVKNMQVYCLLLIKYRVFVKHCVYFLFPLLSLAGSVTSTLTQEVMMRKKNALHLDGRYNTMIENAFYYCNPPEYRREDTRRQRPPQHEYIRRLLYRDLNKVTTEKVTDVYRPLRNVIVSIICMTNAVCFFFRSYGS